MDFYIQIEEFLALASLSQDKGELVDAAIALYIWEITPENHMELAHAYNVKLDETLASLIALVAYTDSIPMDDDILAPLQVHLIMVVMAFISRARNQMNLHHFYNADINGTLCGEVLNCLLERQVSYLDSHTMSGMHLMLTKQKMLDAIAREMKADWLCKAYETYSDEQMLDVTVEEIQRRVEHTAYLPSEKQALCQRYMNKLQQSIERLSHDRASTCTFWIVVCTFGITYFWCQKIYLYFRHTFERELRAYCHLSPKPPEYLAESEPENLLPPMKAWTSINDRFTPLPVSAPYYAYAEDALVSEEYSPRMFSGPGSSSAERDYQTIFDKSVRLVGL